MATKINFDSIYQPSEDVVARKIEGELIIVPISAGVGDMEDELYTLNNMGKIIWQLLDGQNSLTQIVRKLKNEYQTSAEEIEQDVKGFISELLKRGIIASS